MKNILILGQQNSAEVQSVARVASQLGCSAIVVDSQDIPDKVSIEYWPNDDAAQLVFGQQSFPVSRLSGVYWARVDPPKPANIQNIAQTESLGLESTCLLQLLLNEDKLNWVNSLKAVQFHRTKPKQLQLAKTLGANIPPSYVGNRILAIQEFLSYYPKAIYKPIFAGDLTQLVQPHMHEIDAIETWAKYPITLQAFIPGENVRTYVVGDFMISALIQEKGDGSNSNEKADTNVSDYRNAAHVHLIPMQIPINIQQLAVRIMRAFHMQFTAIDWRLTPEGKFVFLEANPAPLFVNAQTQLGVGIDQAIVKLLLAD